MLRNALDMFDKAIPPKNNKVTLDDIIRDCLYFEKRIGKVDDTQCIKRFGVCKLNKHIKCPYYDML
jgi:hypothetical protein